jgi:hypothetical protein
LLILLQAAFLVFLAAAARAGIVSPGLGYHDGHFSQQGAPAMDEALLTDLRFHQLLLGAAIARFVAALLAMKRSRAACNSARLTRR